MTPTGTGARQRARPPGPQLFRIVCWQPLAATMAAAGLFVAAGSREGAPLRLSLAGAAVAAATSFLIDDPAADTLAASPTSLAARRCQRITLALLAAGVWWTAAALWVTHAVGPLPLRGRGLEVAVLVAVALAASAVAGRAGDGTPGGIAGALVALATYATTYLPTSPWLPFPRSGSASGAIPRLLVTLAIAAWLLVGDSRDPARTGWDSTPRLQPAQRRRSGADW